MIQITPQMRILVGVEPVDFRKGIDGLAGICRNIYKADPFSGYLFAFRNKRRTAIRIITYDGQGFWMFHKRLSKGTFKWWPEETNSHTKKLAAHELLLLIWNGDPSNSKVAPDWRQIPN